VNTQQVSGNQSNRNKTNQNEKDFLFVSMSESTNQPTTPSTPNVTSTCCEYFIKTLNKETSLLTISFSCDENEVKDDVSQKSKELVINNNFDKSDLSSFLNFCNLWQQKYVKTMTTFS